MATTIQTQTQPQKQYAQPTTEHMSLGRPLRSLLFIIPFVLFLLILIPTIREGRPGAAIPIAVVIGIIWWTLVSGIRVAAQWERGVILRLGKFATVRGPGIFFVIPVLDYVRFIDTRVLTINIPRQKVITRDNVPAEIDSVLYFMVKDSEKAIVSIQDFRFAVAQYAQATLRDVVGGMTLDELLSEREQIQARIGENVEERVKQWGIHVDSIRLQDIELPEDLKRMMSRQASAEREKRATITKAEGDKLAAVNLTAAADLMQQSPMSMQLRTLQTIDSLGASPSNTVVLFPLELDHLLKTLNPTKGEK
jgi:regulator of protease activity HflC (stomatin/prohibitin superfamily)